MDYFEQSNRLLPFEGLSLEDKKRLFVYMCHLSVPIWPREEIYRKWGMVLSENDLPTAFEVAEIAAEIKEEIKAKHTTQKRRLSRKLLITVCIVGLSLLSLYCYLQVKEKKQRRMAAFQLQLIDEEFGRNTVSAYNKLLTIEKYSDAARCRRHLCDVFGIGTRRSSLLLSECPIS